MIVEVQLQSGGFVHLEYDEFRLGGLTSTVVTGGAVDERRFVLDLLNKITEYEQARLMLPFVVEQRGVNP